MFTKLISKMHGQRRTSAWDFVGKFGPQATYGPQFHQTQPGKHHRFDMTAKRVA
jgi:hypothetical protein